MVKTDLLRKLRQIKSQKKLNKKISIATVYNTVNALKSKAYLKATFGKNYDMLKKRR